MVIFCTLYTIYRTSLVTYYIPPLPFKHILIPALRQIQFIIIIVYPKKDNVDVVV